MGVHRAEDVERDREPLETEEQRHQVAGRDEEDHPGAGDPEEREVLTDVVTAPVAVPRRARRRRRPRRGSPASVRANRSRVIESAISPTGPSVRSYTNRGEARPRSTKPAKVTTAENGRRAAPGTSTAAEQRQRRRRRAAPAPAKARASRRWGCRSRRRSRVRLGHGLRGLVVRERALADRRRARRRAQPAASRAGRRGTARCRQIARSPPAPPSHGARGGSPR